MELTARHITGDRWRVEARLTGLRNLIRELGDGHQIAILYGPGIEEELSSCFNLSPKEYADCTIDRAGRTPVSISDSMHDRGFRYGSILAFMGRKVNALTNDDFLAITRGEYHAWATSVEYAAQDFNYLRGTNFGDSELRDYLAKLYVALSAANTICIKVSEDGRIDHFQRMCISYAVNSSARIPLIFLCTNRLDLAGVSYAERSYIQLSQLRDLIVTQFGADRKDIDEAIDMLTVRGGLLSPKVHFTLTEASFVLNSLLPYVGSGLGSKRGAVLPEQRAAPLMFKGGDQSIELWHSPSSGISNPQASGAARALLAQTTDLLEDYVLLNSVPRIDVKIKRLRAIFERIVAGSSISDMDVIELGVEMSSVEGLLSEYTDRISEQTLIEYGVYSLGVRRLLNRFDCWVAYQAEGQANALSNDRGQLEELTANFLRAALKAGILDPLAVGRVQEVLAGADDDSGNALREEGLARSAENLVSATGEKAFAAVKALGSKSLEKVGDKISDGLSEAAAGLIQAQAEPLIEMAKVRGERWIELLVEAVNSLWN